MVSHSGKNNAGDKLSLKIKVSEQQQQKPAAIQGCVCVRVHMGV